MIGTGVDSRLDPTTLDVPGSASAEANAMLEEHFGPSAPFAILLRGPAAALEEQGPRLVRALRQDPNVSTLSPWDKGSVEGLRPTPEKALILADFHVDTKTAVNETVPRLEAMLERKGDGAGAGHPDRLRDALAGAADRNRSTPPSTAS